MGCERIIAFVLALVLCVAAIEAGSLTKKRSVPSEFFENELVKDLPPSIRHNKLLMRFIDAAIELVRDQGATDGEMAELMRKRAGIKQCFFHAVNCW